MAESSFIFKIVKAIESIEEGLISYAYIFREGSKKERIWMIAVSDYEFYKNNKTFNSLKNAWYKAANKNGVKIAFCYCRPIEENLIEKKGLIMNI